MGTSLRRIAKRINFDFLYNTLESLFNDSLVDENDELNMSSRIPNQLTIDTKHSPLTTEDMLHTYTVDSQQFNTADYDSLDESQPFMQELEYYEEKAKREAELEKMLEENLAQAK